MIFPTLWITRQNANGRDKHGQPLLGPGVREKVCPVKLIFTNQHTTVRTDASASHGMAIETTSNVVLLALPRSKLALNDVLTIGSNKVRVIVRHERYDVAGTLDHIEIHCDSWK